MKRAFLIHGWGGNPNGDWFAWAGKELEQLGYEVFSPEMPDTEHPKIKPWVETLSKTVGSPRKDDVFIGHSIGCQTILRYLDSLNKVKIEKVILIAPWWYLTLNGSEEQEIAGPWLKTFVNFADVKQKANKIICVFSKNDPYVPYKKNVEFFKEKLDPEIITKDKQGHFTEDDGVKKLDFLPDLILK